MFQRDKKETAKAFVLMLPFPSCSNIVNLNRTQPKINYTLWRMLEVCETTFSQEATSSSGGFQVVFRLVLSRQFTHFTDKMLANMDNSLAVIICYGLGPSEGTWVLSITHGTWRGFWWEIGNRHFENRSGKI